jgi:hypothetical protein
VSHEDDRAQYGNVVWLVLVLVTLMAGYPSGMPALITAAVGRLQIPTFEPLSNYRLSLA